MKEIEKTQISGKIVHAHGLEELILLKCPYYPKQSLEIQCNPYQISNGIFHKKKSNNHKICMESKIPISQNNLEKE